MTYRNPLDYSQDCLLQSPVVTEKVNNFPLPIILSVYFEGKFLFGFAEWIS